MKKYQNSNDKVS